MSPKEFLIFTVLLASMNMPVLGAESNDLKKLQIHEILFRIALAQGNVSEAEEEMRACSALAPDDAALQHYQHGLLLWMQRKPMHAIGQFAAAVRLSPENAEYGRMYRWAESRGPHSGSLQIKRSILHETTTDESIGDFGVENPKPGPGS